MAKRRTRRSFSRKQGNLIWASQSAFFATGAGATGNLVIAGRQDIQVDAEIEPQEMTLLRIVGNITSAIPVTGPNNLVTGFVVVDNAAGNIGISSANLADERWLWSAAGWTEVSSPYAMSFDVRGKVRMRPSDELRLAFTNVDSLATAEATQTQIVARALFVIK